MTENVPVLVQCIACSHHLHRRLTRTGRLAVVSKIQRPIDIFIVGLRGVPPVGVERRTACTVYLETSCHSLKRHLQNTHLLPVC